MAEFLTTHGTAYQIENIIKGAKRDLYLVSPYLQLSGILFERLVDADKRGVKIYIIYGKDELNEEQWKQLEKLKNLKAYFSQNLHAKCYFNEAIMIITSMNMYEYSEKNNKEMGVLINRVDDEKVFTDAEHELYSIIENAEEHHYSKINVEADSKLGTKANKKYKKGYCIRCGINLSYNPGKPYCLPCYEVWASFSNPLYEERFCHSCGKTVGTTTLEKPECYECFRSMS